MCLFEYIMQSQQQIAFSENKEKGWKTEEGVTVNERNLFPMIPRKITIRLSELQSVTYFTLMDTATNTLIDSEEYTALLGDTGCDDKQTQDEHSEAQKHRAESTLKWWILLDVFIAWMSAYFLLFCVSSLETTLLDLFHWDSTHFSYLVSCTFLGCIVGPFLVPFFEGFRNKYNVCTLLNNQIILIIGQCCFAVLLEVQTHLCSL